MNVHTLLFSVLLIMLTGCKKDDGAGVLDAEEYFTATVVSSNDPAINFVATTEGPTDYMTARTQGGNTDTLLQLRGKDFDDFLDIQFDIQFYNGSGTYTSGDVRENPNAMRFGQNRATIWWVSAGLYYQQITPGRLTINDTGDFLEGTFSFQAFRQTTIKQVEGRFKVRKDF